MINWPDAPTCHGEIDGHAVTWIEREGHRLCSYCGSLHPSELVSALAAGGKLGGSDWKYGSPHKFYVRIPNGQAGTPIMGHDSGYDHGKWYNAHLLDAGYSEAALTELLELLTEQSGILWTRDEHGAIVYRAPYYGFQKAD